MIKKEWKKELARDFLALGSWIFCILVLTGGGVRVYGVFFFIKTTPSLLLFVSSLKF